MESQKQAEIESELFSLVNSILNLKKKYNEGTINDHFFQKVLNSAMNGLLKIIIYLKKRDITIFKILEGMDFVKEYNKAIEIFNEVPNIEESHEFLNTINKKDPFSAKRVSLSVFTLPSLASAITSSFITLMDALKLESQNKYLIINLLKDLKSNLNKFQFPDLEDIQLKIKQMYKEVSNNKSKLIKDSQYRELIVERLYKIFKEFQLKLEVKT